MTQFCREIYQHHGSHIGMLSWNTIRDKARLIDQALWMKIDATADRERL